MSVNIVPAHDPLVWTSGIVTPIGPDPSTASKGLNVGVHGPVSGSSTADFNAEGIVQKGYVLNPQAGKYGDTLIREGHLVFCHRGDNSTIAPKPVGAVLGSDSVPHTILSLAMLNMILEDAYHEAMAALSAFDNKTRGLPNRGLMDYLQCDECLWSQLYADDGKLLRGHATFKHFYYLTCEGILRRWNYLGASILPSAPDSQSNGAMAYMPLNVCFKGVRKYVANVWGENAGQAAQLYLVLKRRRDPITGKWGAFAFHPFATNEGVVPPSFKAYQGIHGGTEYGTAIYVGFVRTPLSMTMSAEKLAIVQGLARDVTPSTERIVSKQIPVLDVAFHKMMCTTFDCF